MTDPLTEFGAHELRGIDPHAVSVRQRSFRRSRNLALVALVAMVALAIVLYNRPSPTYEMGANDAAWSKDVTIALSEPRSTVNGAVSSKGPLSDLPGVGKIVMVIVDKFSSHKGEAVLFLTGINANYAGLAYLNGYPPPGDSCSLHLGGHWWQISPVNVITMGCDRGFHFTGGG
jgi:hypothetical protein